MNSDGRENGAKFDLRVRLRRSSEIGLLFLVAGLSPVEAAAQWEVSAGTLVIPRPSVGGARAGLLLSAGASRHVLGVPLFVQTGVARTDFTSLGQDYHHNHYFLGLGAEWFPTRGATRIGLRLGLGAYGEYEVVETDPPSPGGDNWVEVVTPGLIVERDLGEGRRLVAEVSDALLGPFFAVLDSEEYGVGHRIRVTLGIRF